MFGVTQTVTILKQNRLPSARRLGGLCYFVNAAPFLRQLKRALLFQLLKMAENLSFQELVFFKCIISFISILLI